MPDESLPTSIIVTAADIDAVRLAAAVEVLQAAFGRWPSPDVGVSPSDYLRWKLDAPGPVPARLHLIEVNGRVAALGVYLPRIVRMRDREYSVNDGVDAAVHPAFQGQGLYSFRRAEKTRLFDRDHDFTLGFSVNERVVGYRRRRGRDDLPARPLILERVNRVLATSRRALRGRRARWLIPFAAPAIVALQGWARLRHRRPSFEPTWQLLAVERFDGRVDALCEAFAAHFAFIQVRDETLLNWRYDPRSGGGYSIILAQEAEQLLGYVVYRRSRGRGWIMDLLALPGRTDVAASLLDVATAALDDCDSATCWVTRGHPYEELLRARGFLDLRADSGMTVRPISVPNEVFEPLHARPEAVHVMLGDSDWV